VTPLSARRLLAVMPHPDDEAYAAAGTLALAASRGAATAVLCVTAGEGGGDRQVRDRELTESCRVLGAQRLPSLAWPDGGLGVLDQRQQATSVTALADVIRAWRPDAVLGLGADGVYGHLDHLALHRLLRAAWAELSALPQPVALWEACFPPTHFHPVWRALRRQKFTGVAKGWTPESFGTARRDADVTVDVRPVAEQKRAAIAAHASQLAGRAPEDFLRPGLMQPLLQTERWRQVAPSRTDACTGP
jgi:N-acetyl-1-D-myo-inositol-2-amino-2-deoxy-alpha-D-glucopyranoside deacetylase